MDKSETYIKMCEKATEIQVRRPMGTISDFWHYPEDSHFAAPTWLPRQDQLQGMVGAYETCKEAIFRVGYEENEYSEYWGEPSSYWDTFTSFEQLWLAFVMGEKCHKRWEGGEWVSNGQQVDE